MILPIKHKRGTTIPTASDLVVGEIAINTATGVCYTKTGAGNVVAIGLDIAANWGNIGGTLSNQTDLQTALDNKYDASNPSNFIPEAPTDGAQYVRQNAFWQEINVDLTGYATESFVTTQGYLVAGDFGTVPSGGLLGQVLTKTSSLDYALTWETPIVGDRYVTTSTTSNSVSNGSKTFTVGTGLSYSSQQDVVIAYDANNHMHALVTSYNSLTGQLVVDVQNHTGAGTYASWTVNVGGVTPLQSLVWGGITGTLDNQTDLADALNLKANLSGATFTGKVNATATASAAGINIGTSTTTPSSLVNGDMWIGSFNLFFRNASGTTRTVPNVESINNFSQPQTITSPVGAAQPALRITNLATGGTAHSLVVEDATNPDTTSFIINNVGAVGIQKDPATWTHVTGTALDVSGRAMFIPTNTNSPSLNVGATACATVPTNATAGDIWITNAASPKLAFQTQGVNYYCVVANQFNTFTGQVAISGASATNPQLLITQTGAGNALVVEDSTSPDTDSFVVNANGAVGIGVNPASGAWVPTRKLEVNGFISCSTAAASADSVDVATTAHVKSVLRGQVISDASQTYGLPGGTLPNVVIKKSNDGSGNTTYIEVPWSGLQNIPVGTQFVLIQVDAYPFVVTPASGVTINSNGSKYRSNGQHSICTLIKTDTNEWYLAGDLTT